MGLFDKLFNKEKQNIPEDAKELYEQGLDYEKQSDEMSDKHNWDEAKKLREKAYECYRKSAALNHVDAIYKMHIVDYNDPKKRYDWLIKAANMGHAQACTRLGETYDPILREKKNISGYAVSPDYEEAITWYDKAVARNDEEAKRELDFLVDSIDYKYYLQETRKIDETQLDQDIENATIEDALNIIDNSELAKELRAAGYIKVYNHASWYKKGYYKCKNQYLKAAYWYKKAADMGVEGAQQDYQECLDLESKRREKEDTQKKYGFSEQQMKNLETIAQLVKEGNAEAQYGLATWYEYASLYADAKKEWAEKAIEYYQKAADQGHGSALYQIAEYYKSKEDYEHAFPLYKKVTEANEVDYRAWVELALCYNFGKGTEENSKEARHAYITAFDHYDHLGRNGTADDNYMLGECYLNGYGTADDEQEAYKWYQNAAAGYRYNVQYKQDAISEIKLGKMYLKGIGVKQDINRGNEMIQSGAKIYSLSISYIETLSK